MHLNCQMPFQKQIRRLFEYDLQCRRTCNRLKSVVDTAIDIIISDSDAFHDFMPAAFATNILIFFGRGTSHSTSQYTVLGTRGGDGRLYESVFCSWKENGRIWQHLSLGSPILVWDPNSPSRLLFFRLHIPPRVYRHATTSVSHI